MIQLPDNLLRVIEAQVAEGRAPTVTAFLTDTVLRLIEDGEAEHEDIRRIAALGIANAEAGRYTTIASPSDEQALGDRLMARLHERLKIKS